MSGNKMRKPDWLKIKIPVGKEYVSVRNIVSKNKLHTICTSGKCPNMGECWGRGTATFMILGDICTRSCKFCATKTGKPDPADTGEPKRLAASVRLMKLKHCVITSVDRDDLDDGGSKIWADTIRAIRKVNPGTTIEALIPDFSGKWVDIQRVIDTKPEVISHNLETVRRLTPLVRSASDYDRSLEVLRQVAASGVTAKSGIMAGLGETEDEVFETMDDLLAVGCRVLTIGQYLQPTKNHLPVAEYIHPEIFSKWETIALEKGFDFVESKPLVRSSYHAEKHVTPLQTGITEKKVRNRKIIVTRLGRIGYEAAWTFQEDLFEKMMKKKLAGEPSDNHLIFCEHDHVITLGKSGSQSNLLMTENMLQEKGVDYVRTNRGGDITYHGPGQIVGYPILNLENFGIGIRDYIFMLEESIIRVLDEFGLKGERLHGATGVWFDTAIPGKTRKICAIGVKASRFVTMHGFAFNVNTDLHYFNFINPCGFTDKSVTSLHHELGRIIDIAEVEGIVMDKMVGVFGFAIIQNQ